MNCTWPTELYLRGVMAEHVIGSSLYSPTHMLATASGGHTTTRVYSDTWLPMTPTCDSLSVRNSYICVVAQQRKN